MKIILSVFIAVALMMAYAKNKVPTISPIKNDIVNIQSSTVINGLQLNGLQLNGLQLNGLQLNGLRFNDMLRQPAVHKKVATNMPLSKLANNPLFKG